MGSSAEKRAEWDAKCEEWRLRFGDKGSLDTLKTLHGKFPANLAIHTSYASALALYSHNEESAEIYEAASKFESSPTEVLGNVIEAALERAKAGQLDKALKLFDEAKSLSKNASDFSYQLAHGINRYAEITKDEELRIEAMERIIWLRPDDDDVRFSLAYAHSEAKNNDMALFHYLAIPSSRRGAHTWNNLGVSYQNFSVPTRSIVAFEKAAAEGNTLAMSNLAYRYMNNGFTREARERLNDAFTKEDPHKNVNEAYATLSEINDNETKIVDEILATTKKKADTFKKLGQAICDPDIITLEPVWTSPDSELAVKIDGKKFEARGRYEVKNILSGLLGTAKPSEYELILTGNIMGRRVFGEIRRKSLSSTASSILSERDQQKRFAIVFASDFQSAEVIESIDTRSPRYYEIRVKSETVALPAA